MASSRQERPADHGGYLFLGPASDALTQHLSAAGMGIITSPSGVAMWSQGWKLCWEKPCLYCLRTRCCFHLPCSLLVWGSSSETPLFPTRAICALTDSQRILRDGAYSSHGLREESSQEQNHVDGGLFPQRSSVYISGWALIPPAPTASPVTALPSLGQGSWSDTMEAGFFGWVIRPSLDLGVQKDKEGGGREGEGEREEGEGCHYLS